MKKAIIKWLVQRYLKGYHLHKNPIKKMILVDRETERERVMALIGDNVTFCHDKRFEHEEGAN